MNRFLITATALALLAGPALAQSSVDSSTETTRTTTTQTPVYPVPPMAPVQSSTYDSSKVTHSDNGIERTDKSVSEHVGPDGSTTTRKVIEQDTH